MRARTRLIGGQISERVTTVHRHGCDNHGDDSPEERILHGGKKENEIDLGCDSRVVEMSGCVDNSMKVADHCWGMIV
jgi:hypothetical protein